MLELTLDEARARVRELADMATAQGEIVLSVDGRALRLVRDDAWEAPTLSEQGLLKHLDPAIVLGAYAAAPGRELDGKFLSPESSSALAANAFGLFVERPDLLPPIPGTLVAAENWKPLSVTLEAIVRFPWAGGRHPCLDILVETSEQVIGIESKRYEPWRGKAKPDLSKAYWRPVWGDRMKRYEETRDALANGSLLYRHLDAAQLIKHAFGLRTRAQQAGKSAHLLYLFAEPHAWSGGVKIGDEARAAHRREIADFTDRVSGDEVAFGASTYLELLTGWEREDGEVFEHAWDVRTVFAP